MATERVITAQIDASNGIKSLKDLQKEVKGYRDQLVNAERGTKEYNTALNNLANTQGRINTINRDIAASTANLTNVYSTITGTLSSVAGGFTAIQGVIALTGQSGEALEKTFVKLQAALALTQGITAFSNGIKSARLAVIAFNTAVASNPLAALVIGITTAAAALAAFTFRKKEDKQATDELNTSEVVYLETLRETEKQLTNNNRLLTAQGKTRNEVIQSDIQFYRDQIRALETYWQTVRFTNTEEQNNLISDRIQEYYNKIRDLEFDSQVELTGIATSKAAKRLAAQKAADDKALKDKEAADKKLAEQEKTLQTELEATNTLYTDRANSLSNLQAREVDLASAIDFEIQENARLQESLRSLIHDPEASIDARIAATTELQNAIIEGFALADEAEALRLDNLREAAEEEILLSELALKATEAAEKGKQDARTATLNVAKELLNSSTKLLGEETAAGKATAIASTTISTYQAAMSAYASLAGIPIVGPALGIAAAAAAVAAGAANVKEIVNTKIPYGSDTSGGGNISLPTLPEVNVPIQETHNNLSANDEEFYNKNSNTRVYVSEGDISKTQKRVELAENEARV